MQILNEKNNYKGLDEWLATKRKVFLVCGSSIEHLKGIKDKLSRVKTPIVRFSDFTPNPLYDSVVLGVRLFRESQCDSIMAIGGGSAIDVAKCIKLYSNMDGDGTDGSWLKENAAPNSIPFLVMPTTAGTGSEATRFAVIYYGGVKQSVDDESIIPETILFDPGALKTLPLYQKKATMCDALCHAIESFWSVNSTPESIEYSKQAIHDVLLYMDGYLSNTDEGNAGMLNAAYVAGKAINITKTTAGHAMCYKLTGLFGYSHGHAAMLCVTTLYPWMVEHTKRCVDVRGEDYLKNTLDEIGKALGCEDAYSGAKKLIDIFSDLGLEVPNATDEQIIRLCESVNPDRLKNHPISLDIETINMLYHQMCNDKNWR